MAPVLARLKTAAEKHALYVRTYRELRRMDRRTGWDVGLFPEDARKIARAHVYGH